MFGHQVFLSKINIDDQIKGFDSANITNKANNNRSFPTPSNANPFSLVLYCV